MPSTFELLVILGVQAIMTGQGPFQNLMEHISDPVKHNILANFSHIYGT